MVEFPEEVWQQILFYCGINLLLLPISKKWSLIAGRNRDTLLQDWIKREADKVYEILVLNIQRYKEVTPSWLHYRTCMRYKHLHDILNQPTGNYFILIIGKCREIFYIVSLKDIERDLQTMTIDEMLKDLDDRRVEIDQEINNIDLMLYLSYKLVVPKEMTIEETVHYTNMYKDLERTLLNIYREYDEEIYRRIRIDEQYK